MLVDRFGSVVAGAVENKVTGSQLLESDVLGASVELVTLIASAKLEAKVFVEHVDGFPDETTAVKEKFAFVQRIILLTESLSVRDAQEFFTLPNELLTQPVFELFRPIAFLTVGFTRDGLWFPKLGP